MSSTYPFSSRTSTFSPPTTRGETVSGCVSVQRRNRFRVSSVMRGMMAQREGADLLTRDEELIANERNGRERRVTSSSSATSVPPMLISTCGAPIGDQGRLSPPPPITEKYEAIRGKIRLWIVYRVCTNCLLHPRLRCRVAAGDSLSKRSAG
jgi:hypothetical protein